MDFQWDLEKAASNLRKHGVSFEEACTAYNDLLALRGEDDRHPDEDREITIGMSEQDRVLLVVSVEKDAEVIRVISARRATATERTRYEKAVRERFRQG